MDITNGLIIPGYGTEINTEDKMGLAEIQLLNYEHDVKKELPDVFKIDRSSIECVAEAEQPAELQSLGLSVYDQETLEQGILRQVDRAIEQEKQEQAKKQVDKELKNVADDILLCEQQLKKSETLIKALESVGTAGQKQGSTVRKDVEVRHKQLHTLKIRQQTLLKKKAKLFVVRKQERDVEVVNCEEEFDTETNEQISELSETDKQSVEETEMERKIRLGEMTPFGSMLEGRKRFDTKDHVMTEFEKYLQDQAKLNKDRKKQSKANVNQKKRETSDEYGTDKKGKNHSPLKKSILMPKKRRKKAKLGTSTSEAYRDQTRSPGKLLSEITPMDDDSEYQPSEGELEELEREDRRAEPKKKRAQVRSKKLATRKCHASPEDWASDDSDWDYSDEETRAKRRKSTKKEIDDGNIDDYLERMKFWEETKTEEGPAGDQELEGGYKLPKVFWNKLYNYQKVGVQWLWELNQQRCGGILGDEMGLGKTIQVIAFLAGLAHSRQMTRQSNYRGLGPVLIVCPTTVMHQWVREFHVWWPPFRVAVLHESGSFTGKRDILIHQIGSKGGVLVTSYVGAVQHRDALIAKDWHYIILDEGHKIRNPDAQVATAYRCATVLRDTIAPYLLRRMKSDVKSHICLPPKNEQVLFCGLTEEQRTYYKCYLDSGEVERILQGHTRIFLGLINLRKICNHPDLYSGGPKLFRGDKEEDIPEEERYGHWKKSGKMIVVESLLKIWKKQGHRVLLFTQSRQMLCILEAFVQKQGYTYLKLDGGTSISARQPLINKYNQNSSYFVFILTTRVGGLGVNLTGADRVVIYDPDWNPATDTQARERAWRIGQQNRVTVYRLVTAGTIEEKIYHRQIFKQFLTNKVLRDPKQRRFFKSNDLFELFTLKESDRHGSTETAAIFAGTGSEVKVDFGHDKNNATPKKEKFKPNKPICAPPTPESKKSPQKGHKESSVKFSPSKVQDMKKLAQMLSQKISASKVPKRDEANAHENQVYINNTSLTSEVSDSKISDVGHVQQFSGVPSWNVVRNNNLTMQPESELDITVHGYNRSVVTENIKSTEPVNDSASSVNTENGCSPLVVGSISDNNKPDGKKCGDSDVVPVIDIDCNDNENMKTEDVMKESQKSCIQTHNSLNSSKDVIKEREKNKNKNKHLISGVKQADHDLRKKRHKHKKGKRKEECLFEGEKVPHLVGQDVTKDPPKSDDETMNAEHDDYVLKKLFKKSGLQTALRHDNIMDGGQADYALVEGEAQRVAQEAVNALKESRRQCWQADSGVPSWTGQSGALKPPGSICLRFGKKKKMTTMTHSSQPSTSQKMNDQSELDSQGPGIFNRKFKTPEDSNASEESMSSSELLDRIRNRNRLLTDPRREDEEAGRLPGSSGSRPSVPVENVELLSEIRNFVAFGALADGRASTQEILDRFKERLPPGSSPLFRFLLLEICEFYRVPSGKGMWRLRTEFKW